LSDIDTIIISPSANAIGTLTATLQRRNLVVIRLRISPTYSTNIGDFNGFQPTKKIQKGYFGSTLPDPWSPNLLGNRGGLEFVDPSPISITCP